MYENQPGVSPTLAPSPYVHRYAMEDGTRVVYHALRLARESLELGRQTLQPRGLSTERRSACHDSDKERCRSSVHRYSLTSP